MLTEILQYTLETINNHGITTYVSREWCLGVETCQKTQFGSALEFQDIIFSRILSQTCVDLKNHNMYVTR